MGTLSSVANKDYSPATRFIDENGYAYGVKQIENKPRVSAMPYLFDIAEGNVSGHAVIRKTGYNPDVDDTSETLWPVGGEYVFPTAGMGMEVISSSANDDGAPVGTGVRTVELHYLDSNYAEKTETIILNGTTAVPTVATNILRIQKFHGATVGSGGVAAGNIDIRHLSDTPIYARIPVGYNSSQQAVWTVPAGKTAYITGWAVGVGNASGNRMAEFRLRATAMEGEYNVGVFQVQHIVIIQDSSIWIPFTIPIKLASCVDIKITTISDSAVANAICGGHFEGWYES